jgi:hypothetical protein
MPQPVRDTIASITLTLKRSDGTTYTHAIDPNECDALAWSDRAVDVLSKFYEPGGSAHGKRMAQADFLNHFPHAGSLIGAQPDLLITPAVINQLWKLSKADGTAPAFLAKSLMNPING